MISFLKTNRQREALYGWLFALPAIIGMVAFDIGPMAASVLIAFTEWNGVTPPQWIGLANYEEILFRDDLFLLSLRITTVFAFVSIPLNLVTGFLLALLLNQKIRGQALMRTLYYLPSIVPLVAVAALWRWIFLRRFGLLDIGLAMVGIQAPDWLGDPNWVLPAFVVMGLWGVGGGMLINLAGLQAIPTDLYDSASIDGANAFQRLLNVTIPMMTPLILFNLVMGIIGGLQVFVVAFVMTQGGPNNASLFYMLHLYHTAFEYFRLGYGSALALILFLYIVVLSALVFRSSTAWVYYEGNR
ncbi:MAG: sugar ABC transporter permease [Caldilineaceae bacterium]|nr:sugar ABC transporter permease [Caldilineaceae bacterium]